MVALPVFPSRVFRHGFITVNRKAVKTPKDLEGKRIGVPLYTQTAAVFIRGMLKDEYGVDLSGAHWVQGATNEPQLARQPVGTAAAQAGVDRAEHVGPLALSELLERGDIQAILGSGLPASLRTNPDVQRLFPDFHAVEIQSYKRTRVFPIMHLVAMRRDVYERHPFIATSLYQAMTAAKDIALEKMRDLGSAALHAARHGRRDSTRSTTSSTAIPGPMESSRTGPTLEALVRYMAEQSLIKAPIPVDDLFVPIYGQAQAFARDGAVTDEARELCGERQGCVRRGRPATAWSP